MKKTLLFLMTLCLLIALPGCGGSSDTASTDTEPIPSDNTAPTDAFITVTPEITQLDPGFSAVRYDSDYAFDQFLEQGGASSDQDVLKFLTGTLLHGVPGLRIDGNPFGCSTISVKNTEGGYYFGRNFDWQTCDALVVTAYPKNGYASTSTVNLGFIKQGAGFIANLLTDEMITIAALYAPLDGMNEKGLCVSVNMIQDRATIQQNTDKPDITTTTAVRLLLDKAANVEEAFDLLRQYDLHASMNYMIHLAIADSEGNSVAVEYIDNKMVVIETPVLTNFYLAEGEKQGIGTQQSHTRFEILTKPWRKTPP